MSSCRAACSLKLKLAFLFAWKPGLKLDLILLFGFKVQGSRDKDQGCVQDIAFLSFWEFLVRGIVLGGSIKDSEQKANQTSKAQEKMSHIKLELMSCLLHAAHNETEFTQR